MKLIRELREEIDRLKAMLMSFELVCSNIYLNVIKKSHSLVLYFILDASSFLRADLVK